MTAATTTPKDREITGPADKVTILSGRFMLPDFSEHPCRVSQLSADGAVFDVSLLPPPGLAILAYIDGIGRVEGRCAGPAGSGFAIAFTHSGASRSRLEKRLKWLSETRSDHGDRKRRPAEHDEPKQDVSHITLADGRTYPCEVVGYYPDRRGGENRHRAYPRDPPDAGQDARPRGSLHRPWRCNRIRAPHGEGHAEGRRLPALVCLRRFFRRCTDRQLTRTVNSG